MGLVQPERLNLDLLGAAMNELLLLPAASATPQTPALTVSDIAYRKLNNLTDFVPTPSGSSPPGSYTYAPNQAS
jgi:hypothetical protein